MRLLLERNGKHVSLFMLKLTNNSIVGWYTSKGWFNSFLNQKEITDIHFMYPLDGNYHKTYKYLDVKEDMLIEKRVYYDEIVEKKFDKDTKQFLGFKKMPRIEDYDDPTTLFFNDKPQKVTEKPFRFSFGLIALPLINDPKIIRLFDEAELIVKPTNSDLILNFEKHKDDGLNICAAAFDKDAPFEEATGPFKTIYKREQNAIIRIELCVLIFNKQ